MFAKLLTIVVIQLCRLPFMFRGMKRQELRRRSMFDDDPEKAARARELLKKWFDE